MKNRRWCHGCDDWVVDEQHHQHLARALLPRCTAVLVILLGGKVESYTCHEEQGHTRPHRDGRKEW